MKVYQSNLFSQDLKQIAIHMNDIISDEMSVCQPCFINNKEYKKYSYFSQVCCPLCHANLSYPDNINAPAGYYGHVLIQVKEQG